MRLLTMSICLLSTNAFAQSFGEQMVNQVQQNYQQTPYAQVQQIQQQNQVQQPLVNMGGREYMTPNGPVIVEPDGSVWLTNTAVNR